MLQARVMIDACRKHSLECCILHVLSPSTVLKSAYALPRCTGLEQFMLQAYNSHNSAYERSSPMTQSWNVSFWSPRTILPTCPLPPVDDAAFLDRLVTSLPHTFGADPSHIYLSGYSNGAMLVQQLLCSFPSVAHGIQAVALLAPTIGADYARKSCSPAAAAAKGGAAGRSGVGGGGGAAGDVRSVLIVHGTSDATLPFKSGQKLGGATMLGAGEAHGFKGLRFPGCYGLLGTLPAPAGCCSLQALPSACG